MFFEYPPIGLREEDKHDLINAAANRHIPDESADNGGVAILRETVNACRDGGIGDAGRASQAAQELLYQAQRSRLPPCPRRS